MGKKRVRRSESRSVSPSCYLNSKLSSRKVRSHSGSSDSENEFNSLNQKKNKEKLIMNSLKSKSEQKELNFITTSSYNSPDYKKDISKKKSNKSKLDETVIRKDDNNDNSDFEHRSADSDKSNGKNSGITPEKTSKKSRSPKDEDYSKRYAQEKALSRNSDAFFENKSIPLSSKSSSKFDESSKSSNICPTLVQKNYLNSSGQIKSKWNVVTNLNESKRLCDDNHSTSNEHLSESSKDILKINDKVLPLANASPSNELEKEIHRTSRNDHETLVSAASLNKNEGTTDQNTEARKNETVKHLVERKRSRSRSSSPGGSCSPSASDRSSRSRSRSHSSRRSQSYSKSRSKSYSKSRSKSYSKSRSPSRSKSHSKSRSRSHTKSCSKSYSRSRSVSLDSRSRSRSYSSRSRSRSIARSPSIPRRRGSPSFLDKRRITSARKRPVPYRRPSPPTPSSTSSWSYHSLSRSSSPLHMQSHSPISRCSSRSRSRSWSPIIRQKYEISLSSALR